MNKHLHRLLIFLIFTSVAASAYLFFTPKNNDSPPIIQITPTINIKTEDIKPATLESAPKTRVTKPIPNEKTPTSTISSTPTTSPPEPTSTQETQLVKFKIEDKEYEIKVKPNISTYEAMETLKQSGQVSFSTKNFSSLGQFVEEINGIKNNPTTGFYWTYYINNQEAKVGISTYIIKPNDLITWKYENK